MRGKRSVVKYSIILWEVLVLWGVSGCGESGNMASNSDFKELSFQQVETPPEGFKLRECTVLEDEINIGAFCFYGEDLVYEVNYHDSLTDQTGLKGDVPFEDKYNTQLRRLNMTTGEDELLYKYDAEGCVDITDVVFNEHYLVWETMEDTWKLHLLRLGQDSAVETIVDGTQNAGDLDKVILTLKEDELFWYNKNGLEDNCISLCSYNIPNKELHSYKSGLDLRSPYTKPAIIEEICTTFSRKQEDGNQIYITDMDKKEEVVLNVNMSVCNPISNDEYCIWTQGYGGESSNIYVYDFDTQTGSVISLGEASCFSYALLGEYIIINQRGTSKYGEEGLYCFRPDTGEYYRFEGLEDKTVLHTFQGVAGNVYFQVGDDTLDFKVVNVSLK